jgi:transcriptional regulator with XRE-family HTH domain
MNHFGSNIKHLRALKGRSQDVVACAIDVKRTTYAGWENGASEPSMAKLVALGAYYQTSLDILITKNLMELRPSEVEAMQRDY